MKIEELNMPHSERHEKSVISTLLQNGLSTEGAETLTPDHFHNPFIRRHYVELEEMEGDVPDLIEFSTRLVNKGIVQDFGGASVVAELYGYAPTGAHFAEHLKKLHILKAKRAQIIACLDAIEAAEDLNDDETFLEKSLEPMTEIHEIASATQRSRTKRELIARVIADFEQRVVEQKSSMGVETPFTSFNQYLRGLHTKRVTVVSGLPSSGKTLFANQLLWSAAQQGVPSLNISLEMPSEKIIERNVVFASRLPAKALTDPLEFARANDSKKPTREHLLAIKRATSSILEAPIHFEDPSNCNVSQIIALIRRHHRINKIRVVSIDYLQLIKGERGLSREQQLSEVSHALQSIAKELDLSLILLSQQNKEGGTKHAEAITEDADLVLAILRDLDKDSETYGQHKGVLVRKDRHFGNNGVVLPIYLIKEMLRFEESLTNPYPESDHR